MEMKEIDLTKCVNCRFRAEISNPGPVSGRIVVEKGVYLVDENGDYIGLLSLAGEEIMSMSGCGITDFEIVLRDPETYRDWQAGDIIENSDNYSTGRIIFRSGDFVAADIEGMCNCYTCGELFDEGYRLSLTDIEQKIIEEKKKYEPKDGDICYAESKGDFRAIFVFRGGVYATGCYISYGKLGNYAWYLNMSHGHSISDNNVAVLRLATDEEKQLLFDAMAKEGKRWNAEKKVVEDIPKPYEFKKGEPVLVRDSELNKWRISAYTGEDEHGFIANTGVSTFIMHWKYYIPYNERTMHLLGTSEDYKEEQL